MNHMKGYLCTYLLNTYKPDTSLERHELQLVQVGRLPNSKAFELNR